jgi:hypothetical protein
MRSTVHGGADGLLVSSVALDVPLRGVEMTLESKELVSEDWDHVRFESVRVVLDEAALAVGRALLDSACAPRAEGAPSADVITAACDLATTLALRRGRLAPKWLPLLEAALAAPIFAVADGARISLTQALKYRPPSLDHAR